MSDNSDILKNATSVNKSKIKIASNNPIALDHDLPKPLNTANATAIPTAITKSWMIEIVSGPILKLMPANNHFFIFLGYTTFMKHSEQLKTNSE